MTFFDFHTHTLREDALVSCMPHTFSPLAHRYYSVGIHPWHLLDCDESEWSLLKRQALHPQVLAIGEAGLDRLATAHLEQQIEAFCWQASLAEEVQKPMVIHAVRTSNELIALRKKLQAKVPWVIHGFRGNRQVAESYLRAGFYLSYGERYQVEALRITPPDRLLLETDEAVVTIAEIYRKVSVDLNIPVESLGKQVYENLQGIIF